jgi:pyruvate, orthophosphate dikinase
LCLAYITGKGCDLALMSSFGLHVPPGFTVSTEVCSHFVENEKEIPNEIWEEILSCLREVELETGKKFGGNTNSLMVSARSGAAISMPGMMDTVLNIGINDEIINGLTTSYGERFALDCYRRLINMFGV